MIVLRLLPVIFSTLLFAAHVLRFNGLYWTIAILALLFTLFIRKPWIIRLWQILLGLAALKWGMVTIELIHIRIAFDIPYTRLTIILILVIIFNVFTVLWLQNKKIRRFYRGRDSEV